MGRACYFADKSRYTGEQSPVNWSGTSGPVLQNSFNDKPRPSNFLTVTIVWYYSI